MSSQSKPKTKDKKDRSGRGMLISFFLVPLISSILSTIHIIVFAALGNHDLLAYVIAGTYEIGSITSFIVVANKSVLKYINRGSMIFIFVMLFLVQAVGNLYSVFSFIYGKLADNPDYLGLFKKMSYGTLDDYTSAMIIGVLTGVLLPLISLIFLKSAADYFYARPDEDVIDEENDEKEELETVKPEIQESTEAVDEAKKDDPPLPDLIETAMKNAPEVELETLFPTASSEIIQLKPMQPPTGEAIKASTDVKEPKKEEMPEEKRDLRLPEPEDEKSTMPKAPKPFKKKEKKDDEPKPEDKDEPEPAPKKKRHSIKIVDDNGITQLNDKGKRLPAPMPFQSATLKRKNRFLNK